MIIKLITSIITNDILIFSSYFGKLLSVNKTKSMILSSRIRCKDAFSSFEVSVCDQPITSVECHKLVGIYLDRNIIWDNHINKLCQKLRSKLYMFNRIKYFLPHHARIQFFNGIVQPNNDYCASVWETVANKCSTEFILSWNNFEDQSWI